MTAKEMFEKLGYKQEKDIRELQIRYVNKHQKIVFDLMCKQYWTTNLNDEEEMWAFLIEEHLAVHQRMKELGWIE